MTADLSLSQAHRQAVEIEEELRRTQPRLTRVITHVEPAGGSRSTTLATPDETLPIRDALAKVSEFTDRGISPKNIEIRRSGSEFSLSILCALPGATSIKDAHDFTEKIERALRSQVKNLGRVMIRTEPAD